MPVLNYPNPFNPVTTIEFDLPLKARWRLDIYNVLGQRVDQLTGESDAGLVSVDWDGRLYSSGVYFYRLEAGDYQETKKMILLR